MAELACPGCGAPLEPHDMPGGVIARACPSCFGVLYERDAIVVPLELQGLKPGKRSCPRCAKPMDVGAAFDGHLELDRCSFCGLTWFDAGEIQLLRKFAGTEDVIGSQAPEAPEESEADAPARPAAALAGPRKARTTDDDGGPPVPREMEAESNPDVVIAPDAQWGGRTYRHFQTSVPVVTAVLGEFPWTAKVGDEARVRDFVCPPYLLSEEIAGKEIVWSAGEDVPAEEIWAAFQLPGAPPAPRGVAPAQPNPWSEELPARWAVFAAAATVCFLAFALACFFGSWGTAYRGTFGFAAGEPEHSRVSELFTLAGRASNVVVRLNGNVDNHWADLNLALINADTDEAFDFGHELSYYHGYEDGESWSEGSGQGSVIVPAVPPGRYYLRIEPETDAASLAVEVVIERDVPLVRLPLLALALLLLPLIWAMVRSSTFESARWMQSDHPPATSGSGDGDDE